jgi:hypothetical protein
VVITTGGPLGFRVRTTLGSAASATVRLVDRWPTTLFIIRHCLDENDAIARPNHEEPRYLMRQCVFAMRKEDLDGLLRLLRQRHLDTDGPGHRIRQICYGDELAEEHLRARRGLGCNGRAYRARARTG